MAAGGDSIWMVVPAGQQSTGGWIDDTLRERAAEHGLLGRTPLAGVFPRQRVEAVRGPDAEERALELCHARGWSDGLPVVVPTLARVKDMLTFTRRRTDDVLGEVDPLRGVATTEKIAANAVMAGCLPEYFPVVLAVIDAVLDPAFNMRGVQTTDENVAPMIIVNGPVANQLDVNARFGALGPGVRANAAIGRALRLVMHNLGGGWPGAVSFAGIGQPGRYTLCLAENEAQSPWDPLHVEMGLSAQDSAVTITRVESVINVTGGLPEIASLMGTAASGFQIAWSGRPTVIVAPAVAAEAAGRGMSKAEVKRWLHQRGRWPAKQWNESWLKQRIVQDGRWPDWAIATAAEGALAPCRSPDDIVLIVAGGDIPIPQNVYGPSWGFPPAAIIRKVELPHDWDDRLALAREDREALTAT